MTTANSIFSLCDLYESDGFQAYISDRHGNDLFISDPERADRIHAAAVNGSDGSTHAEVIQDWRDYLLTLDDITDDNYTSIEAEIAGVERWHEQQGTLHQSLG